MQIGNDQGADAALTALTKRNVEVIIELTRICCELPEHLTISTQSMVDTVPYTQPLTEEVLERVLLGALHPSIRALQKP